MRASLVVCAAGRNNQSIPNLNLECMKSRKERALRVCLWRRGWEILKEQLEMKDKWYYGNAAREQVSRTKGDDPLCQGSSGLKKNE